MKAKLSKQKSVMIAMLESHFWSGVPLELWVIGPDIEEFTGQLGGYLFIWRAGSYVRG
jgi:hypothetical protein